jgi:hypothetical protein
MLKIRILPRLPAAAFSFFALSAAMSGCQPSRRPVLREERESSVEEKLSHGYALLYELMADEGNAEKIFVLKKASERTKSMVRVISAVSREAKTRLESFAAADPALKLDRSSLPEVEAGTRKAISKATAKRLLLGADFEVRFLNSQAKAAQYASYLARTLAEEDHHPERREWLEKVGSVFERLEEKILSGLQVKGED